MSQTSLKADLRLLPRAYWVLVVGTFVNRFGSFVYPFLTLFLTDRHFSRAQIGAVIAGYGGGAMIAGLAGGWFADRYGRRHTIVAGTLANAVCVFSLFFAESVPALSLLTLLAGISGGFYHPASMALVADLVPKETRLASYAVIRLASNAGFAFGTATGGFLVSHSTFWLFAGDSLTTATFGLIALLMLPQGLRTAKKEARWVEALAHMRRDVQFKAIYAAEFLIALVFVQSTSSYALEVAGRHLHFGSLEPSQIYGMLIGWNGVFVVLFELPLTRVTRSRNPWSVMRLGCVFTGIGFLFNLPAAGLPVLFAGMTLLTIGEILTVPMLNSSVSNLAPDNMRGRYMGALGSAWSAAGMIGPATGLLLFGYSPAALWIGCGFLGLSATAILLVWGNGEMSKPHGQ